MFASSTNRIAQRGVILKDDIERVRRRSTIVESNWTYTSFVARFEVIARRFQAMREQLLGLLLPSLRRINRGRNHVG
jgi:hypothetical protein